jgi:ATP-dependent Clp protease ATP-binding subunit ClpA
MSETSILEKYGEVFTDNNYITDPSIARDEEIKKAILTLLTPERSAILTGKPGIGKTAIVEGLAYRIQKGLVPDALKDYQVIKLNTGSLVGEEVTDKTVENRLQMLVDELFDKENIIIFIDEIHMLMNATTKGNLDFANLLKPTLSRGKVKAIGATTTDEYERYILRDKAFVRRFEKIEIEEPTPEQTVDIVVGTIPKIEKTAGIPFAYNEYVASEVAKSIIEATTEYKRIFENESRYPDVALGLFSKGYSQALFHNSDKAYLKHFLEGIENYQGIYPDVRVKEAAAFKEKFKQELEAEGVT